MKEITMGNLFSGSGAWELAAKICGIKVVFEAEIEPFPVALEAKRFSEAIQLGDVSKIDGTKIPSVDILCNSSPCQDLSVAGTRSGLSGSRSSLFMDAVRIAKEMRSARTLSDDNIRHELRFWCWENVPGAISSRNGDDFRTVIEEVARISDPTAHIPKPKKWGNSGVVDGDGWQIAWRIVDSQFFGVPQRRRRLFLICDLAGHSAGEILFERESMSWNYQKIAASWQKVTLSLAYRIERAGEYVRGRISDPCEDGIEIWLPCVGYEGYYEVSNMGRVRNVNGKIRELHTNKGYLNVSLHKDGEMKTEKVHRLVAKAFLSNPDNLPQINHKDEDKTNNHVSNLEWCDNSYNLNYGSRSERNGKVHEISVIATDENGNEKRFSSQTAAARELNGSAGTINQALNGRIHKCYGYTWRYADRE